MRSFQSSQNPSPPCSADLKLRARLTYSSLTGTEEVFVNICMAKLALVLICALQRYYFPFVTAVLCGPYRGLNDCSPLMFLPRH